MTTRRQFTLGSAALCLAAESRAAGPPAAPVGVAAGSGYRLVHDWDFVAKIRDRAALRREFFTRYIYAEGKLDHLNDEWSRYRDNDNHVFTPRGLSLVARVPRKLSPGGVESGMLRSRWSGQYGVFEIRMKVPKGRGFWPAFWLNPEDKRWPPEIDVVEIVNNGRDTTRHSFHFVHGGGARNARARASKLDENKAYVPGHDYSDGFHVFAVEWTPTGVCHLVDGVVVSDREFRWCHDDGTDAGPAHVLVNLAVGGKWAGVPAGPKLFPASLEVAHIRVWQR
jgi:beta-glucanase (GH16 family)